MSRQHRWVDAPSLKIRLSKMREEDQRPATGGPSATRRPALVRTEPTAQEVAEAQRLHDAGLIRGPEENQARNKHLDRLASTAASTRNRYGGSDRFGEEKAESIATRWATRGRL